MPLQQYGGRWVQRTPRTIADSNSIGLNGPAVGKASPKVPSVAKSLPKKKPHSGKH